MLYNNGTLGILLLKKQTFHFYMSEDLIYMAAMLKSEMAATCFEYFISRNLSISCFCILENFNLC